MNVFNKLNDKYIKYPILLEVKDELELTNHAQNTIINYIDGIFRFLEFVNIDDVHNLTEDHFRNYLIHLHSTDLNKKTVNIYNSFIRFFYLTILDYPLNLRRVPMAITTKKNIDFLTPDLIVRLLDKSKVDSRTDCIIKLGLCCGLRINEVASLKVSDIDIQNLRIFVRESKRNKSRYVPIDNTMCLALKRYSREYHLKFNDYMFTFNYAKKKVPNETLRLYFYKFRDLAEIRDTITFHTLRHTFAVNYINAGGDIIDLKYLMGHGAISTTSQYLHVAYNQKMRVPSFIDSLMEVSHNG